jgi:peptidoglycan/xylan/chitin deacetylase (PgdA/CDA1 family)
MLSWLSRTFLPQHGAILAYHGITDAAHPARPAVHVSLEQFTEGVELLQSHGRIIPLSELLARVEAGRSTAGLFALTFDDAYESVLRLALPVLRARGAPATVFPVSTAIRGGGRFWWDRLEDLAAHVAPDRWLSLEKSLGVEGGPAHSSMERIRAHVLRTGGRLDAVQDRALGAVEAEAGFVTAMRSVDVKELRTLAADPLIALGPHTVTHACLKHLPDQEVVAEVRGCAEELAGFGVAVEPVLAVPYGVGDERTVGLAREAGMRWSLGVSPRSVAAITAERPVPRFAMSGKRSGGRFEAQLSGSTELVKRVLGRSQPDWA